MLKLYNSDICLVYIEHPKNFDKVATCLQSFKKVNKYNFAVKIITYTKDMNMSECNALKTIHNDIEFINVDFDSNFFSENIKKNKELLLTFVEKYSQYSILLYSKLYIYNHLLFHYKVVIYSDTDIIYLKSFEPLFLNNNFDFIARALSYPCSQRFYMLISKILNNNLLSDTRAYAAGINIIKNTFDSKEFSSFFEDILIKVAKYFVTNKEKTVIQDEIIMCYIFSNCKHMKVLNIPLEHPMTCHFSNDIYAIHFMSSAKIWNSDILFNLYTEWANYCSYWFELCGKSIYNSDYSKYITSIKTENFSISSKNKIYFYLACSSIWANFFLKCYDKLDSLTPLKINNIYTNKLDFCLKKFNKITISFTADIQLTSISLCRGISYEIMCNDIDTIKLLTKDNKKDNIYKISKTYSYNLIDNLFLDLKEKLIEIETTLSLKHSKA